MPIILSLMWNAFKKKKTNLKKKQRTANLTGASEAYNFLKGKIKNPVFLKVVVILSLKLSRATISDNHSGEGEFSQ